MIKPILFYIEIYLNKEKITNTYIRNKKLFKNFNILTEFNIYSFN